MLLVCLNASSKLGIQMALVFGHDICGRSPHAYARLFNPPFTRLVVLIALLGKLLLGAGVT